MITKDKKAVKIFKGEYKPVNILKNNSKIAGYTETGFVGSEASFSNTYNSFLKLYGKTAYYGDDSTDPAPDNQKTIVSATGTVTVSNARSNSKAYEITDLRGIKSKNKIYNYTENGVNYLSDYIYGNKIVRRVGVYAFTGDETIGSYKSTDNTFGFYTNEVLSESWHSPGAICNSLKFLNSVLLDGEGFAAGDASGRVYFRLLKSRGVETANQFKAFLKSLYESGTPIVIYHSLQTPITETITSPIIKTYPNYTKIKVANDFSQVPIGTNNCIKIQS